MSILNKTARFFNALSIDIAFGAVCSSRLLFYFLEVRAEWYYDLLLALSVWLIYTIDHLIDAKKIIGRASSYRHRFHQKYFFPILASSIIALGVNAFISIKYLYINEFIAGMALFSFVIIHQLLNMYFGKMHFLLGKEMRIALGYTLGISLIPMLHTEKLDPALVLLLSVILILALINLLYFGLHEHEADKKDKLKGIGIAWTEKKLRTEIRRLLLFCGLFLALFAFFSENILISSLLFGMLSLMSYAFICHNKSNNSDNYRIIGDGIFLIPIILFWLA